MTPEMNAAYGLLVARLDECNMCLGFDPAEDLHTQLSALLAPSGADFTQDELVALAWALMFGIDGGFSRDPDRRRGYAVGARVRERYGHPIAYTRANRMHQLHEAHICPGSVYGEVLVCPCEVCVR